MRRKAVVVLTALTLCAGGGIAAAAVGPAGTNGPGLAAVGPVSATDGFPVWYKDKTGLRLENCLNPADPQCPAIGALPHPDLPMSFPDNYPDEAFYMLANAKLNTRLGTGKAAVQLEQSLPTPDPGAQATFARVRFDIDATPLASYTVTSPATPPGGKVLSASDKGRIFDTEDIGIGSPGDFSGALGGRVGPFLTWDDYASAPAPAALKPDPLTGKPTYVGDGVTPHEVVGSPYNTNFFRIVGPNINPSTTVDGCPTVDGPIADCIQTDLFTLQGKLATNSGVTMDQATYSRSSATGGFVDVFASSEPDSQQSIQVTDVSPAPAVPEFGPTGLHGSVASAGRYFARVAYTGAQPPTKVQVSNISDVPVSNKVANVVDRISGTAAYTTGATGAAGSLAINAVSSDTAATRILTASGFGALPRTLTAGALTVPSLDAPPVSVTVTSDAGGTVRLPVEIAGSASTPIQVVAMAGPDQTVRPGQLVTLDGSESIEALTYAWTSPAGIALSDPNIARPTFTAPDLPGTYAFDLTVTGPGGPKTATVTITVAAVAPSPPVIGTATAGNTSATVTWTAPADGGSAITGYSVRVVDAAGAEVGAPRPAAANATSLQVTGLVNGTAVRFQVQASNAVGTGAFSTLSTAVTPTALLGRFTAVTPNRVMDTRTGLGAPKAKVGAGRTLTLTVPGLPAGTTAVAINVTVVNPTAPSYLSVYPGGTALPVASNLNFVTNQTIPNLVLVPLGPGNTVTFYNSAGTVNVVADLVGYFKPGTGAGFTGRPPTRVLNTLAGTGAPKAKLGAGSTLTLTVPGLPAGTTAVAINVTAANPTAAGYLSVYPGGTSRPGASNLNFVANQTIPNLVMVPLGPGNTVTFYNSAGTVDVVADLVGYFTPDAGAGFTGQTPTRVLNTLAGTGAPKAKLGAGRTLTLTVPGLPAGTTAVAINVTATNPTAAGYLTVYPGGTARPGASNLNFVAGQTIPNLVLVPLGPGNTVTFYNSAGTVDVVADLVGHYHP